MRAIDQLPHTLKSISQAALSKLRLGDSLQMLDERSKLEEWVGGASDLEEATGDRILASLQAFHENQFIRGLRQARLICYGCVQPFGSQPNPNRLIEDRQRFMKLLDYVEKYHHRTRSFRKCYRGLLNCYFSYDPYRGDTTTEGRENWETLRKFLDKQKGSLKTSGFNPPWVAALDDHPNLLCEDPCGCYGLAALQGDWTASDELRERLEISDDSWLTRRLILAQVKAVLELDDRTFKEFIDDVLLLLSNHPLHAGAALKILLNRYAQCGDPEASARLRDFAISLWGNPWLAGNEPHWQCSREARDMLVNWLKRHLLHEFFATLAGENADNLRRLNFWELYCGDLLGMYLALGKDAFVRGNKELYRFRKSAKGLVVKLTDGAHDLHALIMQFGQHHVVEFSSHNNVAYFYDTQQGTPPFYFGKGWVEVGALSVGNVLKGSNVAPLSKPIRHQDTKQLAWEGAFAQAMGSSENSIREFCRKYHCRHEESRTRDGYEWILPTEETQCGHEAWSVLSGWGFKSSPDKKGYYRVAG
jgi:hypothetical protein